MSTPRGCSRWPLRGSAWSVGKRASQEKLKTLDDIYRFAVEQTSIARGEFLELTIVLLIVVLSSCLFVLGDHEIGMTRLTSRGY